MHCTQTKTERKTKIPNGPNFDKNSKKNQMIHIPVYSSITAISEGLIQFLSSPRVDRLYIYICVCVRVGVYVDDIDLNKNLSLKDEEPRQWENIS